MGTLYTHWTRQVDAVEEIMIDNPHGPTVFLS